MAGSGRVPRDVLGVLKGFDPDVEEVLASSGHVSLYTMAVESQQWTRKDVEGSLFLLKRRGTPRFRMMVLNKLSTENYVEDIHSGLDFELNPPYLMYTHGNSEIIGVWFYEQEDLYRVENVLMRVKQTGYGPKKPAVTSQPSTSARPAGSKGDDDNFYDKPNAGGVAAGSQQQQRHPQQATSQSAAAPVASVEGASNLATLLRNATLKQQQAAEQATSASSAPLPQPLPPSFFSQPQRVAQPTAPQPQPQPFPTAAAPVQAQAPAAAGSQAAPAPHLQPRESQMLVMATAPAEQQQPPAAGQMGGPLAKLFANAHKPPAVQPQVASPQPAPSAPQQQQQLPGAGVTGGVSDEERVRRLLARIATNDALVKLLAVEMRAVGLL